MFFIRFEKSRKYLLDFTMINTRFPGEFFNNSSPNAKTNRNIFAFITFKSNERREFQISILQYFHELIFFSFITSEFSMYSLNFSGKVHEFLIKRVSHTRSRRRRLLYMQSFPVRYVFKLEEYGVRKYSRANIKGGKRKSRSPCAARMSRHFQISMRNENCQIFSIYAKASR